MILSFDLAPWLAGAALLAYALSAAGRPLGTTRAQAVALVLHGLWLGAGFVAEVLRGEGLRFGFGPVLSLTAWLVLAVHLAESRLVPIAGLRRVFSLCGGASIVLALIFPGDVHVLPHSPLAPMHWALGIASYGLFGVAVLHAAMLDAAERRLRVPASGDAEMLGLPLLSLERLTFQFVQAGFGVLTLAILLGLTSSGPWRWDHKTILSLLAWATFAGLIAGRALQGWRGRQATRWVYAGGVLMLLAYAGSRFVLEVVLQRPPLS